MVQKIFLLIVLMSSVAFAQNENTSTAEPVKIDEFGIIGHCDLGSRLDNLLVELMNKPNAKGYIIFYEGKDALPSQIESSSGESLYTDHIKFRRFDSSRITVITSYRDERATELWIIPENAAPPNPTNAIQKPEIPLDKTLLYDYSSIEFYDYSENLLPHKKAEYEEYTKTDEVSEETTVDPDYEEPKLSAEELDNLKFEWANERFGKFLGKNKKMQGVIVFYADDQEYDINKLTSHFEEGKNRIAKASDIASERIKVVFGGYRSHIQMEFWAVPEKGKSPELTPEERPVEETEIEVENQ